MYKRVYQFLTENNIIYDLQFGFRQNFSTAHALVNLTENIRQALDEGYIGCGIFVDLQKAFDTVDHEILLSKRNHYDILGVSNDWFRSYLSDHQHNVSISGYDSGLTKLNCGVPQGSVLGPLLFLLYINDLNQAIKFCKVHHLADDTNLLYLGKSIKKLVELRKFVDDKILRSIYFAIFESTLNYCSLVWAQNYAINRLVILQKEALRIMTY